MSTRGFLAFVVVAGFVASLLNGCGGSAASAKSLPSTVPVSGVVSLDGKPLASAMVTFVPTGATKGVECVGLTDDNGTYKLEQIRGGSGAPPGEYKVIVSLLRKKDGTVVKLAMGEFPADVGGFESLPPRYSGVAETTLTATVSPMGGEIPFDLKSK